MRPLVGRNLLRRRQLDEPPTMAGSRHTLHLDRPDELRFDRELVGVDQSDADFGTRRRYVGDGVRNHRDA